MALYVWTGKAGSDFNDAKNWQAERNRQVSQWYGQEGGL
jgi:hypothetical protein